VVRRASILALLASLLGAAPALAAGKSVTEASPEEATEAGNLYAGAMAEFDRNELEKALAGFRNSYGHVRSPNSHFMVARTLARLGRNTEAYTELEAVVTEADALGDRYADTAHAAREKRDETRARIGLLTVTVGHAPKGTKVLVADEPLDPAMIGKPVPVLPGDTTVSAVTPDGERHPRTVAVAAGASATVELELAKPAQAQAKVAPEPNYHPRYRVELEAHAVGETQDPPGNATRGAGAGGRVAVELLKTGLLGTTDSLAIAAGGDWIGTSTDAHTWVPLVLQWNLWLTPALSLRFEPGAAVMVGAGTYVNPALFAGARFRVFHNLYVSGRVGIPGATLGASLLL
jgi:hypothetical protein